MKRNGYVLLSLGTVAALGFALVSLISTGERPAAPARLDWGNRIASGRSGDAASREGRGVAADWGKLPLRFEANVGQADAATQFVARGPGYNVLLSGAEATLVLARTPREAQGPLARPQDRMRAALRGKAERAVVRMEMIGANASPAPEGLERLETQTNYFIGNDPSKWHRNVANYGRVQYREVYPGVDVVYYGKDQRLEYDLRVAAGGNPNVIRMRYSGAESMKVDRDGALVLGVKGSSVRQLQPRAYQTVAGVERPVAAKYVLSGNEVRFKLGAYDRSEPLVIDPPMVYSTYFGGTGADTARNMTIDGGGNVYLTGDTTSTGLATAGAFQPALGTGGDSAYVVELNSTATAVTFCTYLGGDVFDEGDAIAVDATGVYVGGITASTTFPGTAGFAQAASAAVAGQANGWLAKLDPTGVSLIYSTYLGGGGTDAVNSLTVDGAGIVYATGSTNSGPVASCGNGGANFPTTAGVVQTTMGGSNAVPCGSGTGDAFVTKLSANGTMFLYSTYIGGSGDEEGRAILIDGSGNAFVAGDSTTTTQFPMPPVGVFGPTPPMKANGKHFTGYVAELNPTAAALTFFNYVGGSGDDSIQGMARDGSGNIFIAGSTTSAGYAAPLTNFPISAGAAQTVFGGGTVFGDAFAAEMTAGGTALTYSTYLGGSGEDSASDIKVDPTGAAYVVGFTTSGNLVTTPSASQAALAGAQNGFVAKLRPNGTQVVYESYHGGNGTDTTSKMALDINNFVYFAGSTNSSTFPTTAGVVQPALGGAGAQNAFAAKFNASVPISDLLPTPLAFGPQIQGTTSAAQTVTYTNNGNAPLTITSIAASTDYTETDNCGPFPSMLAAGANCMIMVKFAPVVGPAGADNGTLTAVDNAAGSPHAVPLTGTFVSATAVGSLMPAMLAFGNQRINTPSASQPLTYTNTGNSPLTINSITPPAGYSETDNCGALPAMLAASASCTINVKFQPTAGGPDNGMLVANDSGPGSPRMVSLTGTGTFPIATLTGATLMGGNTLAFGNQNVGTTSAAQTVTLTNTGTDTLNLTGVTQIGANPADFQPASNTCGATLAPAAMCTGMVSFTPSINGPESATIQITDDSNGVANSQQNVFLTGTGVVPAGGTFLLSAPTTTITVRRGQPATFAIIVSSVSGFNQSVALACAGAPSESTCKVTPTSVTPAANAAVSDTVLVTTTAPSELLPQPRGPLGTPPWLWGLLAAMISALVVAMLPLPGRARLRIVAPVVLIVGLSIFGTACNSTKNAGTPLGPAVLTISGMGGGQTQMLNLTLVVTP